MNETLDETVKEIMANMFGVSVESLSNDSSPEQIPAWDSGEHLNLVMSLEQRFDIVIDIDDYTEMSTLGNIKTVVEKYIDA